MSAPAAPLDWTGLALDGDGRTLIKASAGTGKTWTISVLYLRLLLERALGPREIVVTTFTDAAAQELRERLRERLRWAEREAQRWLAVAAPEPNAHASDIANVQGELHFGARDVDAAANHSLSPGPAGGEGWGEGAPSPATSPDKAWLHARWHDPMQATRDLARLRLAQAELDQAPVGTLHSLCRRVLTDYPFESGAGFALGEMVAADALIDEWASDLWRWLKQGDDDTPVESKSLKELRATLATYLRPGVGLWAPDASALDLLLPVNQADLLDAFVARKGIWALTETGRDKGSLKNALTALAKWLRSGGKLPTETNLEHLAYPEDQLDAAQWVSLREDPALQFAQRAASALGYFRNAASIQAWRHWLDQVHVWRTERLAARGQLTFDELIGRVRDALRRPDGALAARLHAAWPVALVDEFQDTDGQQYDILQAIYSVDDRPRGRLVMIGDPKQAIYRFRGGDIHTYLRAAKHVDEILRLDTNHRSSRALVAAVNGFYALAGAELSARPDSAIRYAPVQASSRRDGTPYAIDGVAVAQPLQLHLQRDVPGPVPERVRMALDACANQIAALLAAGTHTLGDRSVQPGDIAVLLPGNQDIVTLRHCLQRLGVPCVGAGRSSVFAADVARELQVLLYAVEHAGDEAAIRAALATPLYGLGYAELATLGDDAPAWQAIEQQFQRWRLRWQREGVLAVVAALIDHAAPRLLAGDDGERTLTDLRHLGELLQAQSERLHGATQLLEWLARQRDGEAAGGEAAEEQQLRIESDAQRVRLMTLHASKGLEFPLVFLPLMWDHARSTHDTTPIIHEALCGRRVVGFGDAAKRQYHEEGQDERFRVLYVALTRAIHACHVYVLPPDRPADAKVSPKGLPSAPKKDPERAPLDASIERLQARLADGADLAAIAPQLAWREDGWPWRATRLPMDVQTSETRLSLPLPPGHPDAQVYSFSNLSRGAPTGTLEDQAASDESLSLAPADALAALATIEPPTPEPEHPELLALAAVRGADIGNALHAMFEHRTIGTPMARQHALIDRCLRENGVRVAPSARAALVERLARRVQGTLDAELLCGLALGALAPMQQRAEMEFHYALDGASLRALREVCAQHGEPALVPAGGFDLLRGRMTGKIDLVIEHGGRFHVLDYKSNWLGNRLADYAPAAITAAMDAHHYRFQALLYTVAVNRFLRQRLPRYARAAQLGEALYLFVRAIGLAPEAGVWRHRFDDALIDAVDRVLASTPARSAA